MKQNILKLLCLTFCFITSMTVMSQQTSLIVDNQSPGWLSSKIGFSDQQTVENLKVTGYINGTDFNFLLQLESNYNLRVLDLSDVSLVKGGEKILIGKDTSSSLGSPYYYDVETEIKENNTLPCYLFDTFKKLKKLITPKSVNRTEGRLFVKVDTLVLNGQLKNVDLCVRYVPRSKSGYNSYTIKTVELAEGLDSVALQGIHISYSVVKWGMNQLTLPSTIKKLADLNIEQGNIISKIEHPENISFINCSLYGDTIFVPQGTTSLYKNSGFKNMKYFVEMNVPSSINISQNNVKIYTNDTLKLSALTEPVEVYYKELNWESSDDGIATVNSSGEVVGISPGNVVITATSTMNSDAKGECGVRVYEHAVGIEMNLTNATLNIGEVKKITAQTLPVETTDNEITWSSDNENVATVDESGNVTGIGQGSCVITATSVDGGYVAECNIIVAKLAEGISLNNYEATIAVGQTQIISAIISPDDTTNKTVTWSSSNTEVAEVDANGLVTAKKAGKTIITATAASNQEVKATCEVTVTQPVIGIALNCVTYEFEGIGEIFNLEATVFPNDATNKNIRWTSSNESVCVVSNGMVVSVGMGTSVVIATTEDGGFMAVCVVTVTSATGILSVEKNDKKTFQFFDLQGRKIAQPQKGINIIRYSDGTTRKFLIK